MALSDEELASAAGIPVAVMRAIRRVESGGNPRAVRFEPHVFLRITGPCNGREPRCTPAELVATSRFGSQIPYTPASGSSVDRTGLASHTGRAAFTHAFSLDPAAAVRSTSWGTYQVLGGHLIALFGSPSAGVTAFDANPVDISERLLVQWFDSNPRAKTAANAGDWHELALRFNGQADGPWYRRFTSFLESGGGAAVGAGAFLVLGVLGLAAWAATRSKAKRKSAGLKGAPPGVVFGPHTKWEAGLGKLQPEVVVREYETEPRPSSRARSHLPRVGRFKVRVTKDCDADAWDYCGITALAVNEEGKSAGAIEAMADGTTLDITGAFTSSARGGAGHGRGVGTRLYEALAQYACDEGLKMRSDLSLSDYSTAFWQKQVEKGRAEWDNDEKRYVLTASCWGSVDLGRARR